MRMRSNNKRSYTEFSSESFDETNTTLCFTVSKKHDSGSPKSGKWSQEEEQYALQLIHDFEMGTLGKLLDT
jgi:hypothetical protein